MPVDHSKLNTSIVYDPKSGAYAGKKYDVSAYFFLIYKTIPSCIEIANENGSSFSYEHIISVLRNEYQFDDKNTINFQRFDKESKSMAIYEQICDLKNGIVVQLSEGCIQKDLYLMKNSIISDTPDKSYLKTISEVTIYYRNDKYDECRSLVDKLNNIIYCPGSKGIKIICKNGSCFYTNTADVKDPKIEDLKLNYGKEFEQVHKKIYDWLMDDTTEGILLLHGPPGTGKTSYLRYLINKTDNKDFIYMPPSESENISDPSFVPFLMQNKNSILIIEDAENIIKDRDDPTVKTQAVANLLNISDGLLGDTLHQKIIATFNCDLSKIDQALLRKGRLMTQYKFDKLSVEDAQKLADHLNIKTKVTEPVTLADLYNL